MDNGYDYFFSLEQDVIPPKDVIESLLKHNKKIISGLYFAQNKLTTGEYKYIPLLWGFVEGKKDGTIKKRTLLDNEIWQPQLLKVIVAGLGCILIHKDILNY